MKKLIIPIVVLFLIFSGCAEKEKIKKTVEETKSEKANHYVVCIDSGHGFDDPGCESEFLNGTEAEINLILTNLLKKELQELGVTVLTTHNGNVFPTCEEIASKAREHNIYYNTSRFIENNVFSAYERVIYASVLNKEKPINLFISIHINSLENDSEISRYELYYYKDNPFSDKLKELCDRFSQSFDNETVITATESDISYTVTRYTDFPSLLLESGYATNPSDANKLNTPKWRKTFCKSLADEIFQWLENSTA